MNNEEIISKLMDYLYDEMTHRERINFEGWLRDNPFWQKELDQLAESQKILRKKDDLTPPVLRFITPPVVSSRPGWLYPFLAVAASLGLLLIAAAFAKPQLSYSSGVFTLALGKPEKNSVSAIDQNAIFTQSASTVQQNLGYQEALQTKLVDAESRLMQLMQQNNQQLTKQLNQQIKINSKPSLPDNFITSEDLHTVLDQERHLWQEEQRHLVEQLIQYIDMNNQQNTELIRSGFLELSRLLPITPFDNRSTKLK